MMRLRIFSMIAASIGLMAVAAQPTDKAYHKDIQTVSVGKQEARTDFLSRKDNPRYLSLNGEWQFTMEDALQDREGQPANPLLQGREGKKGTIQVPGNWEVQGYDYPIYTNQPYEFCPTNPQPPQLPERNPVGTYERTFTVPAEWKDMDVFLNIGGAKSGMYVYVNDQLVGYNEDSKSATEFLINDYLKDGENTLRIKIYRWSTGSYLECQDFWRISGIERDVALYAQPRVALRDFFVKSTLDGTYKNGVFRLRTLVGNHTGKRTRATIAFQLLSPQGQTVGSGSKELTLEPDAETDAVFDASIADVLAWSSEHPNLYQLVMTVSQKGRELERVPFHVGFRKIEIQGSTLLVNGQPVKMKGVNIHEHNPLTGHYVPEELMRRDFELMKQNNINAVRLCHYPQSHRFYELCDEYGLYVYDEANIESHGMKYDLKKGGTLGNTPEWLKPHMERTQNMYRHDKNYPCVTFWSLGNEAGNGYNFYQTYLWLKEADREWMQRPVNYERALWEWNTDMFVPQYPGTDWLESIGEQGSDRPVMPSEYAHAMGNSTGDFYGQWQAIYAHENLAGGFIWDWVDQGLLVGEGIRMKGEGIGMKDEGIGMKGNNNDPSSLIPHLLSNQYWAYGGDFGKDMPSDGNFLCNGIVNPDRTPHPAMAEIKYCHQNVAFEAIEAKAGHFRVKNRFYFSRLSDYDVEYELRDIVRGSTQDTIVARGVLAFDAGPQQSEDFTIPMPAPTCAGQRLVNFRVRSKTEVLGVPAGYVVAIEQFVVDQEGSESVSVTQGPGLSVKQSKNEVVVASPDYRFVLNKETGLASSWQVGGREYFNDGFSLRPNFWRAPNDNDYGNQGPLRMQIWKEASRACKVEKVEVEEDKWNCTATLTVVYALPTGNQYIIRYGFSLHTAFTVDATFTPTAEPLEVPRIGMRMRLPAQMDNVRYFGRGPEENYVDRNHGTWLGIYSARAADLYYPYVRPQENGHHTDTRWLQLTDDQGHGLTIWAGTSPFEFNALRNSVEDFDAEEAVGRPYQWNNFTPNEQHNDADARNRKTRHTHISDIQPRDFVEVCLDHQMMGVGGYDSWGAKPPAQHLIFSNQPYHWSFTLQPE